MTSGMNELLTDRMKGLRGIPSVNPYPIEEGVPTRSKACNESKTSKNSRKSNGPSLINPGKIGMRERSRLLAMPNKKGRAWRLKFTLLT